jgi:hypothetical protein
VAAVQAQRRLVAGGDEGREPPQAAVDRQPFGPVDELIGHPARFEGGTHAQAAQRQRVLVRLDRDEPCRLALRLGDVHVGALEERDQRRRVVALRVAGALGQGMQRLFGQKHEHAAVVDAHFSHRALHAFHAHLRLGQAGKEPKTFTHGSLQARHLSACSMGGSPSLPSMSMRKMYSPRPCFEGRDSILVRFT